MERTTLSLIIVEFWCSVNICLSDYNFVTLFGLLLLGKIRLHRKSKLKVI